jgi:hypothetical protein
MRALPTISWAPPTCTYPRGGYIQFNESGAIKADSPNYYGSVFCHGPRASTSYIFYNPNCLTNAARIVLVNNGELRLAAAVSSFTVPLLVSNGVLYVNGVTGATLLMTTNVTVAGVLSNIISGGTGMLLRNAGDVSGDGVIALPLGGSCTNIYTGSITPGSSAGRLVLDEYNSAWRLYLGVSGDPVMLNMEVIGNGGVAGIDYDQLELQNMNLDVDLANVEVNFAALNSTSVTNWFLKSNTQLLNEFSSVTGTNDKYLVFFGKSADGTSYGISVIPEPAVVLGALLALGGMGVVRRRC